ncbi:uncharacterized protein [Prorops nasuta]|uniref:uncharacterized protein n=1 Tax=Prorops nasuta TaxID=863751 RepID=UPI0034CD1C36
MVKNALKNTILSVHVQKSTLTAQTYFMDTSPTCLLLANAYTIHIARRATTPLHAEDDGSQTGDTSSSWTGTSDDAPARFLSALQKEKEHHFIIYMITTCRQNAS